MNIKNIGNHHLVFPDEPRKKHLGTIDSMSHTPYAPTAPFWKWWTEVGVWGAETSSRIG